LITGSQDKHVKRISVENREVEKDFGQVCDNTLVRMNITAGGEKLLVGDHKGHLKLISSIHGEVIKDFGRVHDWMGGIMISADEKLFFTSSSDGVLKQWNFEDNTLVKDHGKITNEIWSLCL
jgi:WD40 repeat protein